MPERWDDRLLEGAGREDDVHGLERAVVSPDHEPLRSAFRPQRRDAHAAAERRPDGRRVAIKESHDLVARGEVVWISREDVARHRRRPIWREERQGVPALTPPALGDASALQELVGGARALAEVAKERFWSIGSQPPDDRDQPTCSSGDPCTPVEVDHRSRGVSPARAARQASRRTRGTRH
jgi:hypothetical protein